MEVYRVTMERTCALGLRTWTERRTIPLATRQRLGSLLAYHREAALVFPGSDVWTFHIERAYVDNPFRDVTAEFVA